MLKAAAGIDIRHVPYRGSVPAMLDVIAGHIPFMVVDLQPALQQIREGKVTVLGVTTARRIAAAPDIPTLAEGGLAGFELVAWQGVVAPAGGHIFFISAIRHGTSPVQNSFAAPFRCPKCSADFAYGETVCRKCGLAFSYSETGFLDSAEFNQVLKAELNTK